jgi:hypothetical protein
MLRLPEHAEIRFKEVSWVDALNELDAIAAAFVHGVADETIGFEIFGGSFCVNVEFSYDLICCSNPRYPDRSFISIIRLYQLWSQRLSKEQMENARAALDKQISRIADQRIKPIGT